MTIYSPTAAPLGSLDLPNDGTTAVNASSVNAPFKAIADGLRHVGKHCIVYDLVHPVCDSSIGQFGADVTSLVWQIISGVGGGFTNLELGDRIVVDMTVHGIMLESNALGVLKLVLQNGSNEWDMWQACATVTNYQTIESLVTPYRLCGILDISDAAMFANNAAEIVLLGKTSGGRLRLHYPIGARFQIMRAV